MLRQVAFGCVGFALISISYAAAADEKGELIFNGKDLTGWEGNPAVWSVEDGAIVGKTSAAAPLKGNTFLIWKKGDVDNFRLRLEYKIEGGNSGIQYRSKVLDPAAWVVGGYQADIDSSPTYTGILYEERMRGILTKRGERVTIDKDGKSQATSFGDAAELQKSVNKDDWNVYEIEVRGPRMKHTINGKLMSETVDRDKEHRSKSGVLALQVHAGPPMKVSFKNLRYEKLEPKEKKKAKKKQ